MVKIYANLEKAERLLSKKEILLDVSKVDRNVRKDDRLWRDLNNKIDALGTDKMFWELVDSDPMAKDLQKALSNFKDAVFYTSRNEILGE